MTSNNKENNAMFNNYKPKMSSYDNNDHKMTDKFYVNFVEISASCMHCAKQFSFNNKLYKYIHDGYLSKGQKTASLVF